MVWATELWHSPWPLASWSVVIAAATDLWRRRIPNWLTLPLLAAALGVAGATRGGAGLAESFAACLMLACPYVLLFVFAGGGAGDAKLMGAIGAWLGLAHGAAALVAVAVCGVVLAAAFAVARRQWRRVWVNVGQASGWAVLWLMGHRDGAQGLAETAMPKMPYGVAIFAGVCVAAGVTWACTA